MTRRTAFTDLVGCEHPIQLAGMGGLSTVDLAAAVSAAGGLGMVAFPTAGPADLATTLTMMAADLGRPFGVTFIMPFLDPACVPVAARLAEVIEFSFGPPSADLVTAGHDGQAVVGWQVGTAVQAVAAVEAGVDFVIAQGTEAGGHQVAEQPMLEALGSIVRAVDVPVVAAGGIATGDDVRAALAAGADAVRVGTRFASALEADIHPDYAKAMIRSSAADTEITLAFDVLWPDTPHRVLSASVAAALDLEQDTVGQLAGDPPRAIPTRSPLPASGSFVGNVAATAMYAGTAVEHVTDRLPASAIFEELLAGVGGPAPHLAR
ncbi:MAG: nitronate monooxygenase [Actinomycetota bacterium]